MRIPFRVDPPLNHLDAAAIAGAITPHLNLGEHIAFVEHTPCPPQGCGDGIDVRAEALVLPEGSDLGWTIYLCKRKGRWLASRLGEEEGQAAGCPNPTRQTHTNGKGTPNLPSRHSLDSDETISATQAVALAEDFFHAKAYGYRFDRSTPHVRYGNSPGWWTVIFCAPEHQEIGKTVGRAVTMSSNGNGLRLQHQGIFLHAAEIRLRDCDPLPP